MSDPWATLPYRRLGLDTPHKLSDAAPEDPRIAALLGGYCQTSNMPDVPVDPGQASLPASASRMPKTRRTGRLLREAVRPGSGGGM